MRRWCARPGPPTPRTSDPKPPPPPTHDPIIGLGAVSLNKTPTASPPQRLSPSHGASRIRKRAGSPSHQEPLFPLQLTPRAERCQAGASLGGEHPNPLAHSAKADPPQSLLSERRPDTAEPRPLDLLSLSLSAPSYKKPEPTRIIGLQENTPPFRSPALQRINGFESILPTCRNRCSSPVVLLTLVCSSEPESSRPQSPCAALWRPAAHK